MYINVKTRSHYSMAMSSISIDDIITHARDNKQDYVCLVDVNVMYGALEFYTKAVAANLKPVIGLSVYIDKHEYVLLARDYQGYIKLCNLSSAINHNRKWQLEDFASDHITVISQNKAPGFNNWVKDEDLAIHESLFVSESDFSKYKALLAINKGCLYSEIEDNKEIAQKYLLNEEQARKVFSDAQITRTCKLLNEINLNIPLNKENFFVKFDEKKNSNLLLQDRCRQGLIKRFGEKVPKKYIERIKYELDIIHKMGFDDYFLVVQDYVAFAKQNNIMVGPGRGSAAGSLVSYVLEITNIDPLKYGLIFERFLNSHRQTKPDIDIDFMDNRRQEVIDYLFSKYGQDKVGHIITFQKIKIKTAIRDIARILDIDLSVVNLICKSISDWFDTDIDTVINEKKVVADYQKKYPQLFDLAKFIMGMPRQIGTHAAGIVICNKPLQDVVPTTLSAEGINTIQYSMEYVEPVGLIKMDILGLVNLSIINDCVDEINKHAKKTFNINDIPLDDQKVFKQLCLGNTLGIFQLESPGMTNVVRKIQPQSIEDISIASALFRPGPQANIPLYIKNKKNPDKIEYVDDRLKSVLEPTYGIIIYQEQVIQTLCLVANWSLAQADIVRRAISKKKLDKLESIGKEFIESAIKNGYSEKQANEIFAYLLKFASYGFNHSHSIAYALVSYQLAYLKTYYPNQFYACLLSYNPTSKATAYVIEAKNNGITVLPPDINHSQVGFSIYEGKIIFGFGAIKGIGAAGIEKIIVSRQEAKEWKTIDACIKDLVKAKVGLSALEILAKAGCFDCFINKDLPNRSSIVASLESIVNAVKMYTPKFGYLSNITYTKIQDNKETSKKENQDQFDILGIAFAAHPILEIKEANQELMKDAFTLSYIKENAQPYVKYKTLVYINSLRKIKTKAGANMAFISLEDETMTISDAVTFSNVLDNLQEAPLLAKGKYLYCVVSKSGRSLRLERIISEVKA
ncbi:MAG: DNA polymerase III subunit alpha [Mycoplasma sp.]|nr:DNA polymerase III subunit alpha [Candidatus Hennigella equi]